MMESVKESINADAINAKDIHNNFDLAYKQMITPVMTNTFFKII
jgi:hypothetical protein